MKQKVTKILAVIIAIIIIIGIVTIVTKGIVFELKYQNNKKIEVNLGEQFDKKDIKQITDEVFGGQPVDIQAIEIYKDAISITTTEITDEQKTNLITKINEKYGTELDAESIEVEEIAHIRGRDLIKPYIIPVSIATAIILVYLMIRYNKLNPLKILLKSLAIIIIAELTLLSIVAIARIPVGEYVLATGLIVYLLSTYACTAKFEKDLSKLGTTTSTDKETKAK